MGGKTKFSIMRQPDDISCGPTCLHSIYAHYADDQPLERIIREVRMLRGGGTLGALLGMHALECGYHVTLYSYNLKVFDPSWYELPPKDLIKKLEKQMAVKKRAKFRVASKAYIDFLKHGGTLRFQDLTSSLIRDYLQRGIPILVGLSATYLYKSTRELGKYPEPDDIRGEPAGHFVVLTGYDAADNSVTIADPYHNEGPEAKPHGVTYRIDMEHLICAILLGVMTYDGNLIVIKKK